MFYKLFATLATLAALCTAIELEAGDSRDINLAALDTAAAEHQHQRSNKDCAKLKHNHFDSVEGF